MFRSLFSFVSLLLSIGTIILVHAAEILDGCSPRNSSIYVLLYGNAAIWMFLFLFLCLPFLRGITKMIFLNAVPAFLALCATLVVFYVVNMEFKCGDETSLLLTTGSNVAIAFILFVSELTCRRRKEETPYERVS